MNDYLAEVCLRYVVESPEILLLVLDRVGTITVTNHCGEMLFGRDLAGRPFHDILVDSPHKPSAEDLCGHVGQAVRLNVVDANHRASTYVFVVCGAGDSVVMLGKPEAGEAQHAYDSILSLHQDLANRMRELNQARAQLERSNQQKQEAVDEVRKRNEELRQFVSIVSHDLRAPLVNLQGFVSELEDGVERITTAIRPARETLAKDDLCSLEAACDRDIPEAVRFIRSATVHLDNYIKAMLELSRLGRVPFKIELIDMNELVRATSEPFAHQIRERGISLRIGGLPEVPADRLSMTQIIANLLDNAVKYLQPGRCGVIDISGQRQGGEVVYRVRDNGRGIASQDMHLVFAPFRRAGKQDVPGEGMGLAYVRTLVRRHGGSIECQSQPGEGTTFTVVLPAGGTPGGRGPRSGVV